MHKFTRLQLVCAVVMALFGASYASAFNPLIYASNSRLASGKWVKITIPESGVYEITYDEIVAMGFSDPTRVKVYGSGGNKINELLDGTAPDDLVRVPILRTNNKICFYGNGPVKLSLSDVTTNAHFTRIFNPYSRVGCYFLTEESTGDLAPAKRSQMSVNNYVNTSYCLNFFYHENELATVSSSGKEMLGEDFASEKVFIDFSLRDIVDSAVVIQTAIAANANALSYANGVIHTAGGVDTTVYSNSSSRIYSPSSNIVFYNFASPYAMMRLKYPAEQGQFEPYLKTTSEEFSASMARLDYFIMTYRRANVLRPDDSNQLIMGYANTRGNERFILPGLSSTAVVWNINNTRNPIEIPLNNYNDEAGIGRYFYATSALNSLYVAFDPSKTLKKITSFEPIANQNLHGMPVPDLLIITDKSLHEQAQRLADLHTAVDGLEVAVVDQDKIFNEFSSGVRDGMAYRMFCKMLYDRNSSKLKNLLLFGTGSFDNRELQGPHPGNLLTYQSDNSNYEDLSFTTDDFFGFLGDDSGSNVAGEKLTIGVGRITCADLEEAKSDVDKIVEYYANPDYGVWRNNTMVVSDAPDQGMYMFQGEGYKNMLDNGLLTGMNVSTVHNSQYPRSNNQESTAFSRRTCTEGKQKMSNLFKDGMYFATYVGHAGPISFTKYNNMWNTSDASTTAYKYWPIMTTACCDVAHFDSDTRGIAELMFHKRDGGAIALVTSSRMVYATDNDRLNTFLLQSIFNPAIPRNTYTLGEAYRDAKCMFPTANPNKMSFFLLRDPAMKINYPETLFNITKVNGTDMTDTTVLAQISPLMKFDVEAQVVDANGNPDNTFNGDATVSLYDRKDKFADLTFTVNSVKQTREVYYDREKLAEVTGRVVNGYFKGSVIVPKSPLASNDSVLLRVYAHKDNSPKMVNGFTDHVMMLPYDESQAITDTQAPVITQMFINDEYSFAAGSTVGTNSMLYITVTDDQGINMQANSMSGSMTLVLDGGRPSYGDVDCYATSSEGGKVVNVEFPLNNVSEGLHTLTYSVYDMLGNCATHTITFMVGQTGAIELTTDAVPAYTNGEVSFDMETSLSRIPDVIVRVTDATGNLVWMKETSSFPVTWDMKDRNGNKVPAGLYRFFGTYNDGINYGGTAINKLIVLDPVKTAAKN